MKRTVFILCLVSIIGLMAACSQQSSGSSYIILSGRVSGTDTSQYLSGVIVSSPSVSQMVDTTDEAGYFMIEGLPLEPQRIIFTKEGYQTDSLELNYTGLLKRPLISKHLILLKEGEIYTPPADTVSDTTEALPGS